MRRIGLFLLALAAVAVLSAASAQAQYYRPPAPYYRADPPPPAYDNRMGAPGYFTDDDDDDDVPVIVAPRRSPQFSQMPPPAEPGPAYGHQLDTPPPMAVPPSAVRNDPDALRPPAAVGNPGNPGNTGSTAPQPVAPAAAAALPPEDQPEAGQPNLPDNLRKQLVDYPTPEPAGTLIVDTPNTYLYLVLGNGKAIRYGVRVGREGFTWAGTERISKMSEWPDWHPPSEMIDRQPYLPRFMAGGPGNPLGARALYLGKTLYRIHGTNQPSTIGHYVSSGCVGMLNDDIADLYGRVQVGTRVVVLPGRAPDALAASGNPPPVDPANPMAPPPRPGAPVSGPQPPR
jgi:lipoprotein-anchoring transpeptidase ErfK/SrfK